MNLQDPLPRVCTVEQVRAVESRAFESVASFDVMRKAAFEVARACADLLDPLLFVPGTGNNGGDAYVAASYLMASRRKVAVWAPLGPPAAGGDAEKAFAMYRSMHGRVVEGQPEWGSWAAVVDGLFGIGLSRDLEGEAAETVAAMNGSVLPVMAIDVPSGVCADSGQVRGVAVKAARTVTFFSNKPGLMTGSGRDHAGEVAVADLGFRDLVASMGGETIGRPLGISCLRRRHDSHKGSYGSLAVVGGAEGMFGALLLATRAAVAHGAGKVFAVATGATAPVVDPLCPEVMWRKEVPQQANALVMGVGIGTDDRALAALSHALEAGLPAVYDADALNMVAGDDGLRARLATANQAPKILTPHPAEAARLLNCSTADIQQDRVAHALRLAAETNAVVVLKGSGTVVAGPQGRWGVVDAGNPGLAQAGSGDVLAGIIGALLAQGLPEWDAAATGAWLHGAAADAVAAATGGMLGLPLERIASASSAMLAQAAQS